MSIVLTTAPSQARQAANNAANADQQAQVRPAATDQSLRAPAKNSTQSADTGAARETSPPKPASNKDGKAQPTSTASSSTASATAAPANTANANAANAAASTTAGAADTAAASQPLFAQLLGQADQDNGDAGKKSDDKTDDKTAASTDAAATLLPAMAAPLMALVQLTPAAATDGSAGQAADASAAPVAALGGSAAAPAAPANNAALLNVMNPTAALNAQAMSAQAANAGVQGQGQVQPTASAGNAPTPASAAPASASASTQTYADIVAQLLNNRAPANTTPPLAAAPAAPAAGAGADAGAAAPAPLPAAATLAAHAGTSDSDSSSTTAPAPAAGDPSFGIAAPSPTIASNNTATTLSLSGPAQQWQQPLQQALGDRLQMQLDNNSQQAVIRLEPPNLGSIEIAIRHADGALQVNLSASNSDVLRQLHTIGDSVRQDLSSRQYTDVAVTVSATPRSGNAQNFADGGDGRQRQQGQDDDNAPNRALTENEQPYAATFALNDRE